MKNKITKLIVIFLLLIPFRLPISVLFVRALNAIVHLTDANVPKETLATNVIITKLMYNLVLSIFFLYTVEKISREALGRKAQIDGGYSVNYKKVDYSFYWWIVPIGIILLAFIIVDSIAVYSVFYN